MPRPTNESLALDTMRDLITDARCSLRFARALENGANPAHYGCTAEQYREMAARDHARYKALRSASSYHVGRYGEVSPV